ncbi:glycosyltransferase family 4 protein [Candidatus Micrarchaeota archaeon]|nr:glycosyltransferase family 4 protein [Candidatus Micrarchaeota archaeon]
MTDIRVAEVIQAYAPGDGLNYAALKIADALSRVKGFEVTFLHQRGNPQIKCARQETFLQSVRFIAKNADIAHSHIGMGVLKCNLAKAANPRVRHATTYSVIAPREHYPFYTRAMAFHKAAYAWGIDLAVGISGYACADFEKKFHRPAKLIYDGVDVGQFRPDARAGARFRETHGIEKGATVLGYVSRFNPHKNHEEAIRSLAHLTKDAVLLLGGVGASKATDTFEHCKRVAAGMGLEERVKFLGFIPDSQLNPFYNAIDIHAFPSLWEGFGLNILEASAAGKPTVGYKVYSVQELVGERQGNGFAVEGRKQFSEKLLQLVQEKRLRSRMGARARAFAQKFAWEKVAQNYAREFRELAE